MLEEARNPGPATKKASDNIKEDFTGGGVLVGSGEFKFSIIEQEILDYASGLKTKDQISKEVLMIAEGIFAREKGGSGNDKTAFSSFDDFCKRFGPEIDAFANEHGINPLYLRAFVYTELGGTGFYNDGRLLIRFENYTFVNQAGLSKDLVKSDSNSKEFYRKDANSPWISIHDTPDTRYAALQWALNLTEEAAYRSISMGFPQIMGFNYADLGYSSAKEMYNRPVLKPKFEVINPTNKGYPQQMF